MKFKGYSIFGGGIALSRLPKGGQRYSLNIGGNSYGC